MDTFFQLAPYIIQTAILIFVYLATTGKVKDAFPDITEEQQNLLVTVVFFIIVGTINR
jgi:hypothetical protein